MSDDAYVMAPGMAATPFTADEIRAGCPAGRTTHLRIEAAGAPTTVTVTRFDEVDSDGGVFESWTEDEAGHRLGDVERAPFRWVDLQAHASFPKDATDISRESIVTPLGQHDCHRYEVDRGDGSVSTFWFAVDRPGLPIKFTTVADGVTAVTATLIRDDRAGV